MKTLLTLLILISSFWSQASSLVTDEIKLYTEDIPPFQIVDRNQTMTGGLAHVVVEELLERSEYQAKVIPLPWARAYKKTLNEPNTLLYSIARSPQRESAFAWIGKISHVRYYFYGKPNKSDYVNLAAEDVRNLNVVVVRKSIEYDLLKQFGFIVDKNLFLADSYPSAFKMVMLGRVDAIYSNQMTISGITEYLNEVTPSLVPIYTLNQSLDLYIAANKDSDEALLNHLKSLLQQMTRDGTIEALLLEEKNRLFGPSQSQQ